MACFRLKNIFNNFKSSIFFQSISSLSQENFVFAGIFSRFLVHNSKTIDRKIGIAVIGGHGQWHWTYHLFDNRILRNITAKNIRFNIRLQSSWYRYHMQFSPILYLSISPYWSIYLKQFRPMLHKKPLEIPCYRPFNQTKIWPFWSWLLRLGLS